MQKYKYLDANSTGTRMHSLRQESLLELSQGLYLKSIAIGKISDKTSFFGVKVEKYRSLSLTIASL
jgi:hypothetical protein